MASYQTPGVYVEEISSFPPSVAEVSTAIPAFIGHTQEGSGTIARISTMLEYEQHFGGPQPSVFTVTTVETTWLKVKGMLESFLYNLWERGALQGSTPDAAYFVNVGLNAAIPN